MKDINFVKLVGNLGDAPTENYTDAGRAIAGMYVATNRSWKDKSGEWQKRTEWTRVSAFGSVAEWAIKNLDKGSRVLVEGRLQTDVVEDKYGEKKYYVQVIARKLEFAKNGNKKE